MSRPADGGAPVVLLRSPTEFHAHAVVAALSAAGIDAISIDAAGDAVGRPLAQGGAGIPVQVRPQDLDAARAVLARGPEEFDVDDDEPPAAPSRPSAGMPLIARLGFIVALLVVLATAIAMIVMMVT